MFRKKIHRFLMDSPIPNTDTFSITDDRVVHQVARVLKIEPGEEIAVFNNGSGDIIVSIETITKTSIEVLKINTTNPIISRRSVVAAIAIPKGDTFEFIVQKLTELGVTTIVPLITSRTIKKNVRLERLQTISDEAVEQCGGSQKVTISTPCNIAACKTQFPFHGIAFEPGSTETLTTPLPDTLVMYIGPEGGWSEEDIKELGDVQWYNLGDRILRTETAAIVAGYTILSL